jgi:hypothetical protein
VKKKKKWVHPKHLYFDSSGSAIARFFGTPVLLGIHWASGSKMAQTKLVCPRSIEQAEVCKACETGREVSQRLACLCWDVHEECWAIYMGSQYIFDQIASQCLASNVNTSLDSLKEGRGPDFVLQRVSNAPLSAVVTKTMPVIDSLGTNRGTSDGPTIEQFVNGLCMKSIYKFCADPSKEIQDTQDDSIPPSNFMHLLQALKVQSPKDAKPKASPKPEPEVKRIPKHMLGEDRWDFI